MKPFMLLLTLNLAASSALADGALDKTQLGEDMSKAGKKVQGAIKQGWSDLENAPHKATKKATAKQRRARDSKKDKKDSKE
jgi:hypothetical protein